MNTATNPKRAPAIKTEGITFRLPASTLHAIKMEAIRRNVAYTEIIRSAIYARFPVQINGDAA